MMTGIPIENSIWSAYLLTAFLVIVGFAFYDIFHTGGCPTGRSSFLSRWLRRHR